jgi:hypothetical protein
MQELIAEQSQNWLQLYVDAVTEKNPLKRLALVRQLRRIPRHDESDDSVTRTGPQLVANRRVPTPKPSVQVSRDQRSAEKSRTHLVRSQKPKQSSRRGTRMRSA